MKTFSDLFNFITTNGGSAEDYEAKINSEYREYRWYIRLKVTFKPTKAKLEVDVVTL